MHVTHTFDRDQGVLISAQQLASALQAGKKRTAAAVDGFYSKDPILSIVKDHSVVRSIKYLMQVPEMVILVKYVEVPINRIRGQLADLGNPSLSA